MKIKGEKTITEQIDMDLETPAFFKDKWGISKYAIYEHKLLTTNPQFCSIYMKDNSSFFREVMNVIGNERITENEFNETFNQFKDNLKQ